MAVFALFLVAACSLPRGAALQSEVTSESQAEAPSFQVVEVTRENIPDIASWPATGWHGHFHWIGASHAPSSTVISTGDRVDLTIWDSQENSLLTNAAQKAAVMSGLEVGGNGAIFVPYIDEVFIRGMTPASARAKIQSQLEMIAPSAQVQLSVQQGQGNSVDLVDGVRTPGSFPMPGRNYTVLSLLAAGGGITPALRNPRVKLIRGGNTYQVSAEELYSSGKRNTTLRPGDKVIVEEDDRSFTALGASGVENLIYFPQEQITALEALSLMGGLAENRADPKGVLVLREYPASAVAAGAAGPDLQQVVFTFDLTSADGLFAARKFLIHPQDTVLATESPVTAARTIIGLLGTALGLTARIDAL
ncbi:polysaccharide biosynthesis/export family protein [Aestuariicoccus sp. MJ-SS9]|uniref:polysaccharide biosynthesis/export family protein n=1 Tax=Aestuariicoccus sp. MJ-SS9 TaxID=3079855 RepID=UPI0029311A61|nr:polysaccharide biosynthesis/export family protein [Aestuariicoccus sp. MJ-SS9]